MVHGSHLFLLDWLLHVSVRKPGLVPIIIFTLVAGIAMYVIVDYEYPRAGVVRVDAVD
jgi:uncharacterized membrane-anchored protein